MPIDPESSWIDTVNNIEPVTAPPAGVKNIVDAIDAAVSSKAGLQGLVGSPPQFTFQKAIMLAQMLALAPSPDPVIPATLISQAWLAAATASIMIVSPGTAVGAAAPPTMFSVVIATIVDPPSLVLAQTALMADLISVMSTPVDDYKDSDFGPAFRRAFLSLTYTVTGLDSTPTPAGPLPLIAAALPMQ